MVIQMKPLVHPWNYVFICLLCWSIFLWRRLGLCDAEPCQSPHTGPCDVIAKCVVFSGAFRGAGRRGCLSIRTCLNTVFIGWNESAGELLWHGGCCQRQFKTTERLSQHSFSCHVPYLVPETHLFAVSDINILVESIFFYRLYCLGCCPGNTLVYPSVLGAMAKSWVSVLHCWSECLRVRFWWR